MATFLSTQNDKVYDCIFCNYSTVTKGNYLRHIRTPKHKLAIKKDRNDKKDKNNMCKICNKVYKDRSGLWRHSQSCNAFVEHNSVLTKTNEIEPNPAVINTIMEVVNQNNEFKELIIEQTKQNNELTKQNNELTKQIIELSSKPITTNNNSFNLQLFLNETCKDALNINDFVKNLQITEKDVDETYKIGYVDGITKIFITALEKLEINQRPVHCSDTKRESVYIRHDNKWEKENYLNIKLIYAIGHIVKLLRNTDIQRNELLEKQGIRTNLFPEPRIDVSEVTKPIGMEYTTPKESGKTYVRIARNIMRETNIPK
jgi:hypothetical protein